MILDDLLKCYRQARKDRQQLRSQLDFARHEFERVVLEKQADDGIHAASGAQLEEFKARVMQLEQAREELEEATQSLKLSKREL